MKKLLLLTPLLFLAGCATTDFGVSSSSGYSSSGVHIHSSTSSRYYPYSSTYRYQSYPYSTYGNVYYDPITRRYITLRPGQVRPIAPYRPYRPIHRPNRPVRPPHSIHNPTRPIQRPNRPTHPVTPRPRPGVSNPRPRPDNNRPSLRTPPHHGSTRERIGPAQQER